MIKRYALGLVFCVGCSMGGAEMANVAVGEGDLGATPGGQQDIGAARQMLNQGILPSLDMLTYQGIFSEHDLGFENPEPCLEGRTLCIEARAGTVDIVLLMALLKLLFRLVLIQVLLRRLSVNRSI